MPAELDPDVAAVPPAPASSSATVAGFDQRLDHPASAAAGYRGWALLREACTADLEEATAADDAARIPALASAVAEFALIEHGAIRPGSRRAQQALRVGRLSLARRLITRHLSDTALSPAMVADLLGVSVRYLHILFEATGRSFSNTVTDQRIRESRRLLCETPPRPIVEIAHACGFGSLATFYRIFTASDGLTPGEFRAERRRANGLAKGLAGASPSSTGSESFDRKMTEKTPIEAKY